MTQRISFFGEGTADKALLGGKGFGLDSMTKKGFSVPPGFTITTAAYHEWKKQGKMTPDLEAEVKDALAELERRTGRNLGSRESPLFVSVRSGAPVSMPGMMDTLLNVGCTDESVAALAQESGDTQFAYETYRRFIDSYCETIIRVPTNFDELATKVQLPTSLAYHSHSYIVSSIEAALRYLVKREQENLGAKETALKESSSIPADSPADVSVDASVDIPSSIPPKISSYQFVIADAPKLPPEESLIAFHEQGHQGLHFTPKKISEDITDITIQKKGNPEDILPVKSPKIEDLLEILGQSYPPFSSPQGMIKMPEHEEYEHKEDWDISQEKYFFYPEESPLSPKPLLSEDDIRKLKEMFDTYPIEKLSYPVAKFSGPESSEPIFFKKSKTEESFLKSVINLENPSLNFKFKKHFNSNPQSSNPKPVPHSPWEQYYFLNQECKEFMETAPTSLILKPSSKSSPDPSSEKVDDPMSQYSFVKTLDDIFLPSSSLSSTLLDKTRVYKGSLANVRFTGSKIEELDATKKTPRQGTISLVTEDGIVVSWEGSNLEEVEEISYADLSTEQGTRKRTLSFRPQLLHDARTYMEELRTIGDVVADTKRVRKQLSSIPTDPVKQVMKSIEAVFKSWDSPRAISYRQEQGISSDLGTAVNIQMMVFGNRNEQSGTAVLFSSSVHTGGEGIHGEYLIKAQGESIVAGTHTPQDISCLKDEQPDIYHEIARIVHALERDTKEIQDIEITWDSGKVYTLQHRAAKVTPTARVRFTTRLHNEGVLPSRDAIAQISLDDVQRIADVREIDADETITPITAGKPGLEQIVCGQLAFTLEEAEKLRSLNQPVIYCRPTTSTHDVEGMRKSTGIITITGGASSHAAIVALALGKVAIVGCEQSKIEGSSLSCGGRVLKTGDYVTLDGSSGKVYAGIIPTKDGRASSLVQHAARIARELVQDLPIVYVAQCQQDLEGIPAEDSILYDIDYDCLDALAILEGRSYETYQGVERSRINSKMIKALKEKSQSVAQELQQRESQIALTYSGVLSSYPGMLPENLRLPYLAALLQQLGKSEREIAREITVIADQATLKTIKFVPKKVRGTVNLQPQDEYRNGIEYVQLCPWAVEESYIDAAKQRVSHGN